ncbi:helix-turn-helix domain-containing protein [Bacillus sp. SL00103]
MKTTKYSIEEIAIQCGYRNANYLNKVFRKKIGMSPKQLRETAMHKKSGRFHNWSSLRFRQVNMNSPLS